MVTNAFTSPVQILRAYALRAANTQLMRKGENGKHRREAWVRKRKLVSLARTHPSLIATTTFLPTAATSSLLAAARTPPAAAHSSFISNSNS
jgi:hypothetical protein